LLMIDLVLFAILVVLLATKGGCDIYKGKNC
jgi:hypothetical protein